MNFKESIDLNIDKIKINSHLKKFDIDEIRKEIYSGLTANQKHISSRFFYDEEGSRLFEQITKLPEYYPGRTEKKILETLDLSFIQDFENLNIFELGSGDHSKISLILNRIPKKYLKSLVYHPIDISKSAIQHAAERLIIMYPEIKIKAFVADFIHQLDIIPKNDNRLFCFLGSTIGNFTHEQSLSFLKKINNEMTKNDYFLLGLDTIKKQEILNAAYNDKQGITAAFNLNILKVINKICETDFNTNDFSHIAYFNEDKKRIEMHLEAKNDISIKSNYFPDEISFKKGERIHTENSQKYDNQLISQLISKSGFKKIKIFSDENNWFNLVLLKRNI